MRVDIEGSDTQQVVADEQFEAFKAKTPRQAGQWVEDNLPLSGVSMLWAKMITMAVVYLIRNRK